MIVTTTGTVDGRKVDAYLGLVSGQAIMGTNFFRDIFAGVRDLVGGRSRAYEKEIVEAKRVAVEEMTAEAAQQGADAVIGVSLDYEVIGGDKRTLLMAIASGTAVKLG